MTSAVLRHPAVRWLLVLASALLVVNVALFYKLRSSQASPASAATLTAKPSPRPAAPYRLLLVFSPTDCSALYSADIATWRRLAREFPPEKVRVEIIACYTNSIEYAQWSRDSGIYLPHLEIDPQCSRLAGTGSAALPTPVKLLLDERGQVLYAQGPAGDPRLNLALREEVWKIIQTSEASERRTHDE